ncbi:protein CHROMATIN REMODELING 25-like [Papaver somniferum]|uniref:protein CHROMATIN REMODELING 25-like n=1 Tax=Papaver somniferum TaxID=3469 RepID=UPI000E6FE0FA|nr:protein CHROMATIN REMODELING 25-like [Papaver somniferum]
MVRKKPVCKVKPAFATRYRCELAVQLFKKQFIEVNGTSDEESEKKYQVDAKKEISSKRFVPWGSSRPVVIGISNHTDTPSAEKDTPEPSVTLPEGIEPLVLWKYEESGEECVTSILIVVDPVLVRFLRPHQRLGKTLQSIALLYTLLRQGFDGEPMAKKAIIVTPTSLVSNWESEIKKWVGDRLQLIALCESTRDDVVSGLDSFIRPHSPYQLIYNTIKSGLGTSGFEDCICFFPPAMFFGRSGAWTGGDGVWVELFGKMHVLARLLAQLRSKTDDRIVLVSNYTQVQMREFEGNVVNVCKHGNMPVIMDSFAKGNSQEYLENNTF